MNQNVFWGRRVGQRNVRKVILLLCEGEKTEPFYFRGFPYNKEQYFLDIDKSRCTNAKGIINDAISRKNGYKAVWCIFDKDRNEDGDFNNAITKAAAHGINCAYSNECFELWFLLHFILNKSALHRHGQGNYSHKITEWLKKINFGKYEKERKDMYKILRPYQKRAIINAKKIHEIFSASVTPSNQNPVTIVYKLVEQLNSLH